MAWVITAAYAVWGALAAAATVIASVAAVVAVAVYNAIVALAVFVWSTAAGLVVGMAEGFGIIGTATSANILSAVGAANAVGLTVYTTAATFIGSVVTAFKTFLEVIHFKTLIQIHQLAYILSEDYRTMMNEVYGKLSEFSSAIGLGSQFITLALRNARNVVLDVSSMLGRSYDLGEVTWLTEMNNFFGEVNTQSQIIADSPYVILNMIDEKLMRPSLNTKGSIVSGLYSTIDNTLDAVNGFVENVDLIRNDIEQIYNDLPESIQKQLQPFMSDVIVPITNFIADEYRPQYKEISRVVTTIETRVGVHKQEIDEVVGRLKKPGDLLESVNALSESEAKAQRDKMFEVVNKPIIDSETDVEILRNETSGTLDAVVKALEAETKPPDIITLEKVDVGVRSEGEDDTTQTWMVGDF